MTDIVLRTGQRERRVRLAAGLAAAATLAVVAQVNGERLLAAYLVVLGAVLAAGGQRRLRAEVVASGDVLTVVNPLHTYELSRSSLTGFRVAARVRGATPRPWAELASGERLRLVAVEGRDLATMERELAALEAWRTR